MNLLILGFSTRGLAECAALSRNAGYSITTLDYFGDMDQKRWGRSYSLRRDFLTSSFSPEIVIEALHKLEATGVSHEAVAYTSSVENHPEIIRHLAEHKKLLGNSAQTVMAARDFQRLHHLLQKVDINYPKTLHVWRGSPPPGDWLCKPHDSGGGNRIVRALPDIPVPDGYMLQEFCQATPASVSFVANGTDAVILGLSEQLCGLEKFAAKPFLYCGNIVPLTFSHCNSSSSVREQVLAKVRRMVNVITAKCGLIGVNGIDFLVTDEGNVLFLEVNPRYSSSMELYRKAYGLDIFGLHVEAFQNRLPNRHSLFEENPGYSGSCWGKTIVYAPWDLVTVDTNAWFDRGIRDIPQPGEEIPAETPLCTVFAKAKSRDGCLAALEKQQAWVLANVRRTG